jgi:hypothetical protein
MNRFLFLLFILFLITSIAIAQTDSVSAKQDSLQNNLPVKVNDSLPVVDSMQVMRDSTFIADSLAKRSRDSVLAKQKEIRIIEKVTKDGVVKIFTSKEKIFYYLIFLFLLLGLLRQAFTQYFNNFFRVFFRSTLKQRQEREQLVQSPLPSVLLNCFFVLSVGLYITFLLSHFQHLANGNFWLQYVYCMGAIAFIYITKFLGLKLTGWLFHVNEITESYIFIVFIINKMMGIVLLPFVVLFAFTTGDVYTASLDISWIIIALLFGYRFILSYEAVRKEIKLNPFHFILYICAFEIVPLLLIYKLLLIIF